MNGPPAGPPTPRPARLFSWEALSGTHAALFVVAASWGFGGNIAWMRLPLSLWGTLGALLVVAGVGRRWRASPRDLRPLWWLAPWGGLVGLVLIGSLNPNTSVTPFFETDVFRPVRPAISWLPSSARPDLARSELWLLSGLYLTGVHLALLVRRRRVLRRLFFVLAANAGLLAIFGTAQKLLGAPGLFFGVQPSPNPTFFGSFIYHNHWGAFALLMLTLTLGLIAHYRGRATQGTARSPAPLLWVGALLLAATIPLAGSRSSTLLLLLLLMIVVGWLVTDLRAQSGWSGRSPRRSMLWLIFGVGGAVAVILWLSGPVLQQRWAKTREQFASWQEVGGLGGREILYRDTWRMARDRPWTGWGLESYETVFVRYNSATSPRDRLRVHFDQAHSDWLQALAEIGFIGTALLLLMVLVPLWSLRRHWRARDPVAAALGVGCILIILYAAIEFPFANPAVTLIFWILLFGALRHARLSDV